MTNPAAYGNYIESEILSADPVELIAILYRAAIDSIGGARDAVAAGDIESRAKAIGKALAIVSELHGALDGSAGGEIATNLDRLYAYTERLLIDANLRQAAAPLAEAQSILVTLYEGWRGAQEQLCRVYLPEEEPAEVNALG